MGKLTTAQQRLINSLSEGKKSEIAILEDSQCLKAAGAGEVCNVYRMVLNPDGGNLCEGRAS